nr:putative colanic acid biosynthesis acetyltransferase [Diaphorobacter sp.]
MIIRENNPRTDASFTLTNRIVRQLWGVVWLLFFRPSPRPLHRWRAFLLKLFGAKLGKGVHVYPGVKIWAPWNIELGNFVGIGDGATLYCMDRIVIGECAVISQGVHLCGGSHDYNSPNFQLYAKPIVIGAHAWICAEAFVSLGVEVAVGVVVGARSVVTKSITEPWTVHAGHPARIIGARNRSFV